MSDGYIARPSSDPVELVDACAGQEPGASRLLAAVAEQGGSRWQRSWVVERTEAGTSTVGGVVVVNRICANRWTALPILRDPDAAPALARVIDDSRALTMEGPAGPTEHILGHLRRSSGEVSVLPLVVMDGLVSSVTPQDVDSRTRLATLDDLDRLVGLYDEYELTLIPTVPRLRRYLRDRVERELVGLLEERGQLLAAGYASARTNRFMVFTGLTADPHHRGRGLGAALLPLAALRAKEEGLGMAAVWAPSNAIRLKPARVARWTGGRALEGWTQVWLGPPQPRVRGLWRVQHVVEGIEGRVRRRPVVPVPPVPDPGEPTT